MAKGKGKGKVRTVYRKAKKSARRMKPKAAPLGVLGGAAGSMAEIIFNVGVGSGGSRSPYTWLTDKSQKWDKRITYAGSAAWDNATHLSTYYPLGAGVFVSASPKIPIIKMGAKPLDNYLKRASHGKAGL